MIYVVAPKELLTVFTDTLKNPEEEMDSVWRDLDIFHALFTTWEKPVENYTLKEKS